MTAVISLRGATKRFRTGTGVVHTAVHDLTFDVAPGEFVAVVGPTGCGKSTTLALVSGLEPASAGEVLVRGEPVRGIPAGVGYMFQTDAVFPWRSVLDNVAAGPRYRGTSRSAARASARTWVKRVGLAGFEAYDLEEAIALADRVVVMTASPATVKATFPVPLQRPRDVEEIRLTTEFLDTYREVWECLRDEVARSRSQSLEEARRAA